MIRCLDRFIHRRRPISSKQCICIASLLTQQGFNVYQPQSDTASSISVYRLVSLSAELPCVCFRMLSVFQSQNSNLSIVSWSPYSALFTRSVCVGTCRSFWNLSFWTLQPERPYSQPLSGVACRWRWAYIPIYSNTLSLQATRVRIAVGEGRFDCLIEMPL